MGGINIRKEKKKIPDQNVQAHLRDLETLGCWTKNWRCTKKVPYLKRLFAT